MNVFQRTCCFFALLASTSALSETELLNNKSSPQEKHNLSNTLDNGNDKIQRRQSTPKPIIVSANMETGVANMADIITVNARVGQQAALDCWSTAHEKLMVTWKIKTHNGNNCVMSFRTDTNKRYSNCSTNIAWDSETGSNVSLNISSVRLTDEGLYTCETVASEGTFTKSITLNVEVSPQVTLTSDDSEMAVCQASIGKPAASISWDPACEDCYPTNLSHPNKTVTVVSKYKASSENETQVICVVTHPTFSQSLNLSKVLSRKAAGTWPQDPVSSHAVLYVWLPICVSLIIIASFLGFIFFWMAHKPRQCYCWPCQQDTSVHTEQNNIEDKEVEPYASYMQKENVIYSSISELTPE